MINVWKSDKDFQQVITSPTLGKMVAELGGWNGARVGEDQFFIKPPGCDPLVFHRDTPYFDFSPLEVITMWFSLDDLEEKMGPL